MRSSIFLQRALAHAGIEAAVASGVQDGSEGPPCGFFDGEHWRSHAWVCSDALILDLTADQFSSAEVIVTSIEDARYRRGSNAETSLPRTASQAAAVDAIWPAWTEARQGS